MRFVVLMEMNKRWVWELRSAEGTTICRSTMSYGDRDLAFKAIQDVRGRANRALVFDPLGTLYEGV